MDDDTSGHIDDNTADSVMDTKKERKNAQLAAARESAKNKKRQRDDDLDTMKSQLSTLTKLLESESDSPPQKRKRVTAEPDDTEPRSSWTTSAVRTAALMGLAGASFYFQNVYGKQHPNKKNPAAPTKTSPVVFPTTVQPVQNRAQVGSSGFRL
jgi:hypothetical protein